MLKVVCAILANENRILCTRRGPGMSNAGLWEFPGGKMESGEDAESAIIRELKEELDLDVMVLLVGPGFVSQAKEGREIELIPCICQAQEPQPLLREHDSFLWLPLTELHHLNWSQPDLPIIDWLMERKEKGLSLGKDDSPAGHLNFGS